MTLPIVLVALIALAGSVFINEDGGAKQRPPRTRLANG